MAPESVSFRITRSAEDLAQTVSALSQRLVRLEQRLAALELQAQAVERADPRELDSLDAVERLLHDCRSLLEATEPEVGGDGASGHLSPGEPSVDGGQSQTPYHQAA